MNIICFFTVQQATLTVLNSPSLIVFVILQGRFCLVVQVLQKGVIGLKKLLNILLMEFLQSIWQNTLDVAGAILRYFKEKY